MRTMDSPYVIDHFFIFKIQIDDPTGQNGCHMKSNCRLNFMFFLLFFMIVENHLLDLIIMSHLK
jgi:hypothetical protein